MTAKKIALVSGANKGLGFEISKQLAEEGFTVIMTARDPKKGQKAAEDLKAKKLDVLFCPMDVTDRASVLKAAEWVAKTSGRLDVLINNAGIMTEKDLKSAALSIDLNVVRETFETNVLGHLTVSQVFIPLMRMNHYGRIVNISSGLGTLSDMQAGYTAYRISKTALNALTRILAAELAGTNILINSMCPGWCRTDMGGPDADRSAEEGARTAVYLATLPDGGPTGEYFRDKKKIAW